MSIPFDADVLALQKRINASGHLDADGKPLAEDGRLGPKTRAAIAWWSARSAIFAEAPCRVPPFTAWINRTGVLAPHRLIDDLRGLVDEVSLCVNGIPVHNGGGMFATLDRTSAAMTRWREAGYGVVPMLQAIRLQSQHQQQTYRDVLSLCRIHDTDLELDTEGSVVRWTQQDRGILVAMVQAERARGWTGRIRVNDYAALQQQTVRIIEALQAAGVAVVATPQAYSVDSTSYSRDLSLTAPGGVHWPGVTQAFAARQWAPVWDTTERFMGLASYKQGWRRADQRPMTTEEAIRTAVKAAIAAGAKRIQWWEAGTLSAPGPVRNTIEALVEARKVGL